MLLTLQGYILRELLKTFGLTVLALTVVFTLGGGLYNAMRFEGVTAADLFYVLPMLLPIALTVTMPVSALFAATMLYGRLAADSELLAVRAAGINVHRMFLPALLLAVGVSAFTLVSTNLMIPRSMKEIEYYARRNVRDLAFHKLRQAGVVEYHKDSGDRYYLTADSVRNVTDDALRKAGFEPSSASTKYFWVDTPIFIWIDRNETLQRYIVAEGGLCQFDIADAQVRLTVWPKNAHDFESGKPTATLAEQSIGPIPLPIPFPVRPAMADLRTLRAWRAAPWLFPDLERDLQAFVLHARIAELYERAAERLAAGDELALTDRDRRTYALSAAGVAPGERSLKLTGVELQRDLPQERRPVRAMAPLGELVIGVDLAGDLTANVKLERKDNDAVLEYNPRAADAAEPLRKDAYQSPELRLPSELLGGLPDYPPAVVLDRGASLELAPTLTAQRAELLKDSDKLKRKVAGLIHGRLSFAASPLVTVVMGAILGVMFRGARALGAFGLACIPLGAAAMFILIGRQQIDGNEANIVGQAIIWGGLAAIALTDWFLVRRGVPR